MGWEFVLVSNTRTPNLAPQGIYWLLTIPHYDFLPFLPNGISYIKGQVETGSQTGYLHWQILAVCDRSRRLGWIKSTFGGSTHAELSRSSAADEYVWKEDTRVDGAQFELGSKPFKRNSKRDWESILSAAKSGNLDGIDSSVVVCHFSSLLRIRQEYLEPVAIERSVVVFWGGSGLGKSRRAWEEAGLNAYPKDPRSKFWDGYRGQGHVVVDEFRGGIDVAHLLRWCDRYPVLVEVKGSSTVLKATKIWFTSNLSPLQWYPDLDQDTTAALLRRLTIVHFDSLQ